MEALGSHKSPKLEARRIRKRARKLAVEHRGVTKRLESELSRTGASTRR